MTYQALDSSTDLNNVECRVLMCHLVNADRDIGVSLTERVKGIELSMEQVSWHSEWESYFLKSSGVR
jgi:hypothetical protein